MADGDVALYGDGHGGVDRTWNNCIYFDFWKLLSTTCHSDVCHRKEVGDRVGEEEEGGQGGPEEGEGEDGEGTHQVHQVIDTQGHHETNKV